MAVGEAGRRRGPTQDETDPDWPRRQKLALPARRESISGGTSNDPNLPQPSLDSDDDMTMVAASQDERTFYHARNRDKIGTQQRL
jgi:hypothetical protein